MQLAPRRPTAQNGERESTSGKTRPSRCNKLYASDMLVNSYRPVPTQKNRVLPCNMDDMSMLA